MKIRKSVSSRLTLTILIVTLSSLVSLCIILDSALKQFFIQDAQTSLTRQAITLSTKIRHRWTNLTFAQQLADLLSQQGKVQVLIFDSTGMIRVKSEGVQDAYSIELPSNLISQTLAGVSHEGQFWIASDPNYPQWLYSTALVQSVNSNRIVGAVYIAMPLRRPRQFAQQLQITIMAMAVVSTTLATTAGLLLSRTLTNPLRILHRQARQLEAGDYTARSALKGHDELAQLSRLLDQMADKLMRTLAALQAQENARRELVANVSHDLRTPIASLRLGLEAILDGIVVGEKVQEYLQRAYRETNHLTHLVEQLLVLSKADASQLPIKPESVSLTAIAQECLFRMQPAATQAGLELELSTHSPETKVWVDPELTGQAILNLVDNAIKYASSQKLVRINILSPVEKKQRQYIPLQVQDYGQGISADVIHRVTERFYRISNSRPKGGFGLGLSIAQQICQLQGGFLQLESELNYGTIVTLFLPLDVRQKTEGRGQKGERMNKIPESVK